MKKITPHIFALLTEIIWAFSYMSMKVVVAEIDPILSALYRYLIASVALSAVFFLSGRRIKIRKDDRKYMLLMGLFGITLYFIFENIGVKYTTTANVALIIATIPVFTLFAENIKNRKRSSLRELVGVVLSFAGIALIVLVKDNISFSFSNMKGDIMILICALSWVLYTHIIGKLKGNYDGLELTFYTTIFGTVFLMPTILFTGIQKVSIHATYHLIYLAVVCSVIAYIMYLYSLKILGAVIVNTYINVQPVITVLVSIFILKETIYPMQIIGSVIIIIGVLLVSFDLRMITEKRLKRIKKISRD